MIDTAPPPPLPHPLREGSQITIIISHLTGQEFLGVLMCLPFSTLVQCFAVFLQYPVSRASILLANQQTEFKLFCKLIG